MLSIHVKFLLQSSVSACSCIDCFESCPLPPPPEKVQEPFTIHNYDGCSVIMIIIFVIISIVFIVVTSWRCKDQVPTDNDKNEVEHYEVESFIDKVSTKTEHLLEVFFTRWGTYCAEKPWRILLLGCVCVVSLSYGIKFLNVTTDPVELWAAPDSRSRIEREYFDSHFEPFYRIEQVIIQTKNSSSFFYNTSNGPLEFGPVFHKDFLLEVYELQEAIKQLSNGSLQNICYAPLRIGDEVSMQNCASQTIWEYFKNSLEVFNNEDTDPHGKSTNYLDHLLQCFRNPYNPECFSNIPVDPAIALGGFLNSDDNDLNSPHYEKASSVILTFLVSNHYNKSRLALALAWEQEFIGFMEQWTKKSDHLNVAFTSERSISDELNRGSKSDIPTIMISYVLMLVYIAFSLGQIKDPKRTLVDSKVTLAVGGVVIVLASVIASAGVFGFIGISATLIIFEVIPFLVLAVGVDNIFILVQTHQREPKNVNETNAQHIGRILGKTGPSILLSSLSECTCFLLGALSSMPAVKGMNVKLNI